MSVAMPASAALGHKDALLRLRKIVEQLPRIIVVHDGANWNPDLEIVSATALAIAAFTVPAAFGAKYVVEAEF